MTPLRRNLLAHTRSGLLWLLVLALPTSAMIVVGMGLVDPAFAPVDARNFYTHAEMVRTGETLYEPWPEFGPHFMTADGPIYPQERMPYPPFLTPILSLVSGSGARAFFALWHVVVVGGLWGYAGTLGRMATGRATLYFTLAAGTALLLFPGTWLALNRGNVDPLLWFAIGAAIISPAFREAGFLAVAMVKIYGIWPFLLAARVEGGRVLKAGLGILAAGIIASSMIMGPAAFVGASIDWFRWMLPTAGQGAWQPWNVSLSFAALRVAEGLGLWSYEPGPLPTWARVYLAVVTIGAPLTAAILSRGFAKELRYAIVTCIAVLFSPLCWLSYAVLLYAPMALTYRSQMVSERHVFRVSAGLMVFFTIYGMLTAIAHPIPIDGPPPVVHSLGGPLLDD